MPKLIEKDKIITALCEKHRLDLVMLDSSISAKKKGKEINTDELLEIASNRLKRCDDYAQTLANTWAFDIRQATKEQQIFATKAVNDILFEAKMGTLHRNSVKINDSDANISPKQAMSYASDTSSVSSWRTSTPTNCLQNPPHSSQQTRFANHGSSPQSYSIYPTFLKKNTKPCSFMPVKRLQPHKPRYQQIPPLQNKMSQGYPEHNTLSSYEMFSASEESLIEFDNSSPLAENDVLATTFDTSQEIHNECSVMSSHGNHHGIKNHQTNVEIDISNKKRPETHQYNSISDLFRDPEFN